MKVWDVDEAVSTRSATESSERSARDTWYEDSELPVPAAQVICKLSVVEETAKLSTANGTKKQIIRRNNFE